VAQLMDITRSLTFNLGRYEQMTTTVTIRDIPMAADAEDVSASLDEKMEREIARAALATVHPADDNVTSVYAWDQIIKEGVDA
jgi:hypothetical protein